MIHRQTMILFLGVGLLVSCRELFETGDNPGPRLVADSQRLGRIEFRDGTPTPGTSRLLSSELVYQRALRVYGWGEPLLNSWGYKTELENYLNPTDTNLTMLVFRNRSIRDHLGPAPNRKLVYGWYVLDLTRTGPVVVEVPGGILAGMVDFWQREVAHLRPTHGGTANYIVLPPGYDGILRTGYFPVRSSTKNIFIFARAEIPLGSNIRPFEGAQSPLKVYPLADAPNPGPNPVLSVEAPQFDEDHFKDSRAFEWLVSALNSEGYPNDPSKMNDLAALGVVRGMPLSVNAIQKGTLAEAATTGDAMARTDVFGDRFATTNMGQEVLMSVKPGKSKNDTLEVMEQRTHLLSRLRMSSKYAFYGHPGTAYIVMFKDNADVLLDGNSVYRLSIPALPAGEHSWTVKTYERAERNLINPTSEIGGLSKRAVQQKNQDGSVDIYFGPQDTGALTTNWIQTISGSGFFIIFSLYAPIETFLDDAWRPADVVLVRDEVNYEVTTF